MLERQLGVASLLHFNDQRHTAFGISEGKGFPHVLVGDWIHHLEVWIGPALDNSSSNLGLHVGIIEVDDRQGHSGIAARVFTLQRVYACADNNHISFASYCGEPSDISVAT